MPAGQLDDRIPVLVGSGELVQRPTGPATGLDPIAMIESVALEAAEATGAHRSVWRYLDRVLLLPIARWSAANPVDLVARTLHLDTHAQYLLSDGGESPVDHLNWLAGEIAAGRSSGGLVAGCNVWHSLDRAVAAGVQVDWPNGGSGRPTPLGRVRPGWSPHEIAHGLDRPNLGFAILETAYRASLGRTPDEHAARLGELMAPFTEIAESNPYAWFPTRRTALELASITPSNRIVAYPYPKYLHAVIATDQAAALILMSAGAARAAGIPSDRWVYWWGGQAAEDPAWFLSTRADLSSSAAMRSSFHGALDSAGVDVDEVGLFDFYSCFPIMVEMAAAALGLDPEDKRGFTVAGGLPYFGGPASGYTLHSTAAMARRLRADPEAIGMVTGNGFFAARQAAAVWSGRPSRNIDRPTRSNKIGPPPDPLPLDAAPSGRGVVDGYTVLHDRDGGPQRGTVIGRTSAGRRFVALLPADIALLTEFEQVDSVGRTGVLRHNTTTVFEPT